MRVRRKSGTGSDTDLTVPCPTDPRLLCCKITVRLPVSTTGNIMSQSNADEPQSLSKSTKTDTSEQDEFVPEGTVVKQGTRRAQKVIVTKEFVTNITTFTIEYDVNDEDPSTETKETTTTVNKETIVKENNNKSSSSSSSSMVAAPNSLVSDSEPAPGLNEAPDSTPATHSSLQSAVQCALRSSSDTEKPHEADGANEEVKVVKTTTTTTTTTESEKAEKGKFHDHGPEQPPPAKKPASSPNPPPGPFHVHDYPVIEKDQQGKRSKTKSPKLAASASPAPVAENPPPDPPIPSPKTGKKRKRTLSEQRRHHDKHHKRKHQSSNATPHSSTHRHHHEGHDQKEMTKDTTGKRDSQAFDSHTNGSSHSSVTSMSGSSASSETFTSPPPSPHHKSKGK